MARISITLLPAEKRPNIAPWRGSSRGRTASAMPGLDIAEQRSWQNFLDSALAVVRDSEQGVGGGTPPDAQRRPSAGRARQVRDRIGPDGRPGRRPDVVAEPGDPPEFTGWRRRTWCAGVRARTTAAVCSRSSPTTAGRGCTMRWRRTATACVRTSSADCRARRWRRWGENCRRIGVALKSEPAPARLGRV